MVALCNLSHICALAVTTFPILDLVEAALPIASRWEISAYDACSVALGDRLHVPLVTADMKLIRKLDGSPYDVRWLGVLALPDA